MEANFTNIQAAFADMAANGWATSKPLKWGHFFVHPVPGPLWQLAEALSDQGYQLESLHRAGNGAFVLQVSIVCTRSAQELHEQDQAFNALAEQQNIAFYDGWDAGPTE